MRVYNPEDQSLIELHTEHEEEFHDLSACSDKVKEYAKFYNRNYNIVEGLEEQITKHGHLNLAETEDQNNISNLINR